MQRRAGVAAEARSLGRGISSTIPPGVGTFLEAQRMAILAAMDDRRRVWASVVTGKPGFITAPDSRTLSLAAGLPDSDPLSASLAGDAPVGVLVLDPERRRRIRLNGRAVGKRAEAIEIRIEEVFGNCPKYIQARAPEDEAGRNKGTGAGIKGVALSASQTLAIERADTFFIASAHGEAGADASHRGGQPGFVRVVDDSKLRFPDYAGNNMFQTLGNIAADPRVGLLFVDFASGTTLQLTGRARILWDRSDFLDLPGAERAVEVEIDEIVEIPGQGPLGWRFLDYSPFNPR